MCVPLSHTCHDQCNGTDLDMSSDTLRWRTRAGNIQLSHPDLPYLGPDRSKVCSYPRTMQASPMYSTSSGNTWPSQLNMRSPEEKQLQPDASHNITTTQEEHKTQTITPVHPYHDLTLYKEAKALCQAGSITCPWSLMQFGFVICLQKGLIFHCLHLIFTTFIC